MATQSIPLKFIKVDESLQSRATLKPDVVHDYADRMKVGDKFPPLICFHDGEYNWLADGFQRFYAAEKADIDVLEVDLRDGTYREALMFAACANQGHGSPRTTDDKQRAVWMLLEDSEYCELSNRQIAELLGVSHTFVNDCRTEFEYAKKGKQKATKTVGKDGKTYTRKAKKHFTMCARCSRIGKPTCAKCETKEQSGRKPLRKGERPVTSGQETFDWKGWEYHFGFVIRGIDAVAKAYDDKGPEFHGCIRMFGEAGKLFESWRKKILGKKGE